MIKKKRYPKQYIELSSEYRDRRNYPCPAEFVVPITCSDTMEDPLRPADKVIESYIVNAFYQVPYAAPKWDATASPRSINGVFYSSLWPLSPNLNNTLSAEGQISAHTFSGGTSQAPILNSVVFQDPNVFKAGIVPNVNFNPYYTKIKNYFAGALLLRFKTNPSNALNKSTPTPPLCDLPFSFCGFCESAIITSFDENTGEILLDHNLSEDYDPTADYYLIDFNTDPSNQWNTEISGGPRIFIPGGPNRPNAYSGFFIENFTSSENINSGQIDLIKIKSYDATRRIAYLSDNLNLLERPPIVTSAFPVSVFGSNSFVIRQSQPMDARSLVRLGVANNSISMIQMKEFGQNFKIGETIGSRDNGVVFNDYYDSPSAVPNAPYPAPNYYIVNGPGTAFRGTISSVNKAGGLLEIEIEQQGQGFALGNYFIETSNKSLYPGTGAVIYIPQTYQSIEIYRRDAFESKGMYQAGDYLYLPLLGRFYKNGNVDTDPYTSSPSIPVYNFAFHGDVDAPEMSFDSLFIRKGEFPPRILDCTPGDPKDFPKHWSFTNSKSRLQK